MPAMEKEQGCYSLHETNDPFEIADEAQVFHQSLSETGPTPFRRMRCGRRDTRAVEEGSTLKLATNLLPASRG